METEEVLAVEVMKRLGLSWVNGVYYADVHLRGGSTGVSVALHGARTLKQAMAALPAFSQVEAKLSTTVS